jgi:hypothetical protein
MVVKRTMDIHRNKFIGCGSRRMEEAEEFVVLDAFSSPSAKARTSFCYYLIPLEALPLGLLHFRQPPSLHNTNTPLTPTERVSTNTRTSSDTGSII